MKSEMPKHGHQKALIEKMFRLADIEINGSRPWDIQIHNDHFYARVITGGSLAFGESYMDGWWDVPRVDQLIEHVLRADLQAKLSIGLAEVRAYIGSMLINYGSKNRAFVVAEQHYDLGNDLFEAMLDKRLVYTCAYWKDAKNLDEAQEAKLDLVCRKIGLKAGQRILDIGCGWGSFAKFAAEKYGAHVVGVTVSKEQVALGNKLCAGLPVDIRLMDYRDLKDEKFDHIISLGMFEHVGSKNYRTYIRKAAECLKDDGLFLLHTIGDNNAKDVTDPWIFKYIFPGGELPSPVEITTAIQGLFILEDWHNFGPYYDQTLMAWFHNFDAHWPELKEKYGDRFYRMWKYYLLSCAASFRVRNIHLWQIVLSKRGVPGGYTSVR